MIPIDYEFYCYADILFVWFDFSIGWFIKRTYLYRQIQSIELWGRWC